MFTASNLKLYWIIWPDRLFDWLVGRVAPARGRPCLLKCGLGAGSCISKGVWDNRGGVWLGGHKTWMTQICFEHKHQPHLHHIGRHYHTRMPLLLVSSQNYFCAGCLKLNCWIEIQISYNNVILGSNPSCCKASENKMNLIMKQTYDEELNHALTNLNINAMYIIINQMIQV